MTRIQRSVFGQIKDKTVYAFTLENDSGMKAEILNYGGVLRTLFVPDRQGKNADVVLGFDNLEGYLTKSPFFGTLVGRYANRIADASFVLNNKKYQLVPSEGKNQLHGGKNGFDKKIWDAVVMPCEEGSCLALSCYSVDGEEGFPGNLETTVVYTLTADNRLSISYTAKPDQDTPVNLTNHSYFNLAGHNSGSVLAQQLQIQSDAITEIGEGSIPTGKELDVTGTPFDFRKSTAIGDRIGADFPQLRMTRGYDHNFVIRKTALLSAACAVATDPVSGRCMTVYTDKPGVQLYTGNFLGDSLIGKENAHYKQYSGFCLETQFFPDSVNQAHFPSAITKTNETYNYTTIFAFSLVD